MVTEHTWEAIPSGNGEYVIVDDTGYDPETICTVHAPGQHAKFTAEENAKMIEALPGIAKWKEEAIALLMQWDDIGDMVGGSLGSSKVDNVRSELARLRIENAKLLSACKAVFTTMDSDHVHFCQLRDAIAEAKRTT